MLTVESLEDLLGILADLQYAVDGFVDDEYKKETDDMNIIGGLDEINSYLRDAEDELRIVLALIPDEIK